MRLRALTRGVSPALAQCELTFMERAPIDLARAEAQHAAYCDALAGLGLDVARLPGDAALPDCCFVEDNAVVVDEVAVLTSMGADSRRGELPVVEAALARDRKVLRIERPARIDGGDVLIVGRAVFVGQTRRTDAAGTRALADALRPHGYAVTPVSVPGALHLKSAATALDADTLLVNREWVDLAPFARYDQIDVDPGEPWAANVLAVAGRLVMHAGFPRTRDRLEARGYAVEPVDVSEFLKAEAGVTCKSIVYGVP